MTYPFNCSAMVKGILDSWPEISNFVAERVKTWRGMKANVILPFSKLIADKYFETYKNSEEAGLIKDNYYYTWGTIGIETNRRKEWHFPFAIINLITFGVQFEDVLNELSIIDEFIDLPILIDTLTRLDSSTSVNFRKREIDFLKTLISEKNETAHGILSFEELGQILGISLGQARNYWKNLDKFFSLSVYINYSKLGLFPVLIKHKNDLTDLEREYTKFSFYDNGNYYSLVFLPLESSWIEENLTDPNFHLLGEIEQVDFDLNLTHLTEKAQERWGTYPGIQRKSIKRKPLQTVFFDKKVVNGFHRKDFDILQLLSNTIGRTRDAANYLNVSESYYCQRMAFLAENSVFITRKNLFVCGLDVNLFLVLFTDIDNSKGQDIIHSVKNGLVYLPYVSIYSGRNSLLTLIRMPSRWMNNYMLEFQNLTGPGGLWYENGITAVTHNCKTKSSTINRMNNLKDLVILQKESGKKPGKLNLDWTFEIPRTKGML